MGEKNQAMCYVKYDKEIYPTYNEFQETVTKLVYQDTIFPKTAPRGNLVIITLPQEKIKTLKSLDGIIVEDLSEHHPSEE